MTLKGGTSPACAACKYQRRKCTPECLLAPYFRPDQPKTFQNAHKLFGVRKIHKIIEKLDPAQKTAAMHSIIYQANARDQYPVHGCLAVIRQLYAQMQMVEEELHAVHAQLSLCRQQQMDDASPPSQLDLAMAPPTTSSSALPFYPQPPYPPAALPITTSAPKDAAVWVPQYPYHLNNTNNASTAVAIHPSQLLAPQPLAIQQQQVVQDYDEIHPFFDTIDDRQSYIDSKEAYESRYISYESR